MSSAVAPPISDKRCTISISAAVADRLDAAARRMNTTMTAIVEAAVAKDLDLPAPAMRRWNRRR